MKRYTKDNIGYVELVKVNGDEKLISKVAGISYDSQTGPSVEKLIRLGHTSPLEFADMIFKIKAPIFTARQLFRHRHANYMEKSGRYTKFDIEFYLPENNKKDEISKQCTQSYETYIKLLDDGIKKEEARMILPVNMYTTFYWKINMRSMINFLNLRLDKHAQKNIREYANLIYLFAKESFPSIKIAKKD